MGLTLGIMRDELETESRWQENEFHKWDWKKRGHWEREQRECVCVCVCVCVCERKREREILCLNLPHISPSNSVLCVRELSNHSNFMVNLRGFSDFWQTTLVHHRKWRKGGNTHFTDENNFTLKLHRWNAFPLFKNTPVLNEFPVQKACMSHTWGYSTGLHIKRCAHNYTKNICRRKCEWCLPLQKKLYSGSKIWLEYVAKWFLECFCILLWVVFWVNS